MEKDPTPQSGEVAHDEATSRPHTRAGSLRGRPTSLEVCPGPVGEDLYNPELPHEKHDDRFKRVTDSEGDNHDAETASTTSSSPDHGTRPEDFPDGGTKAWLTLFGAWCSIFCTFGIGNSTGVFQAYYTSEALSQYAPSTISWVTSVMLFTLNFLPVLFGILYDHFGPRWIIIFATLLYSFGFMMVSLSTAYWHFFVTQSILAPIGASAGASVSMSTIASWFYRRRATAFAIMMSGSSAGGIVLPIMMTKLIERIGFPWMMRSVAFMFLGMMGISCVTIRARLPPTRKPFIVRDYFRGLKEPAMATTVTGMFLFFWGMFLPFNFVILQAEAQGMRPGLVVYLLPIMHGVSLFGRIVAGVLADRYGRYNIMICITLLCTAVVLGLWIPGNNNTTIIVFVGAFGFCTGAFTSLSPTLIAQISNIREIGTRTGTAFGVQSFGALTGSPIASAIVQSRGGDYLGLQLFCGMVMFGSCLTFIVARYVQVGFKMSKI